MLMSIFGRSCIGMGLSIEMSDVEIPFNWALREAMFRSCLEQGMDPKMATYASIGYFMVAHNKANIPRSMRKYFEDGEEE